MSKGTPVEPRQRPLVRDFSRIKRHGGASAAELAEFLAQLRGRRPQEVLGLVAQSGLVRATALSGVGIAALLAVLTVVPYALGKAFPEEAKETAAAPAAQSAPANAPAEQARPATDAGTSGGPATAAAPNESEPQPDLSPETLERLDVEGTIETDPAVNPLEDRFDDLLDDAE